jgi:hypothetical protein
MSTAYARAISSMAAFGHGNARWKVSPRKPGIPDLHLEDTLRFSGYNKRRADRVIGRQVQLSEEAKPLGRHRPPWLHPNVGYERNPFTRAYTFFYEGNNTIDERLARIWSKDAHILAEKKERIERERRAYLSRSRGNAELTYPHAIPLGPRLDPTWQQPSSLQYTPASGTSANAGTNVLSTSGMLGVTHLMSRVDYDRTKTGSLRRKGLGLSKIPTRSSGANVSGNLKMADLEK